MDFSNLGLIDPLLRAVHDAGYAEATAIQEQAIPIVLRGRDVMGCAQTGTGKTAAFGLPTLQRLCADVAARRSRGHEQPGAGRAIRALILAPTRELAAQIAKSLTAYGRFTGLRCAVVFGGVSQTPQVRALRTGVDILVATPGRLLDLMGQGHVDLTRVSVLILDEADQMLDMGFLPALRKVVAAVPRRRQTLMFSATMPDEIRELASRWLREPQYVHVDPVATPAKQVLQSVYLVEAAVKSQLLVHLLQHTPAARTLVFTRTKHGADKVTRLLVRFGIPALAIHGNKSQNVRTRTLQVFQSSTPPVLVATDIAARGLDIKHIAHVINYELPEVPEIYVHRIGRTGRAGATGTAVSFCSRDERCRLRDIERLTRQSIRVETEHPVATDSQSTSSSTSRVDARRSDGKDGTKTAGRRRAARNLVGSTRRSLTRFRHGQRRHRAASDH
jgi:ATP-dependent RNA helicase RhlE